MRLWFQKKHNSDTQFAGSNRWYNQRHIPNSLSLKQHEEKNLNRSRLFFGKPAYYKTNQSVNKLSFWLKNSQNITPCLT